MLHCQRWCVIFEMNLRKLGICSHRWLPRRGGWQVFCHPPRKAGKWSYRWLSKLSAAIPGHCTLDIADCKSCCQSLLSKGWWTHSSNARLVGWSSQTTQLTILTCAMPTDIQMFTDMERVFTAEDNKPRMTRFILLCSQPLAYVTTKYLPMDIPIAHLAPSIAYIDALLKKYLLR